MKSLIKHPSALVPIIISLGLLVMMLSYYAIFGIVHETDEGTGAHIFQILMVLQVPIIIFFVTKYFPRNPKQTLRVLSLQIGAMLAAFLAVFFLT